MQCPQGVPAAEEPLSTRFLLLADLQRLAHLAARIAQLAKLLLQPADEVGACAHSIGLGCSSMEACRDEGGMVRGEGVGVGVLCAPEAAGTSTTVVLQPLLRSAGFMLQISNLLPPEAAPAALRPACSCWLRRGRLLRTRALEHHESSGPGVKVRSSSLFSASRGPRTEKVMRIPAKLATRKGGSHGVTVIAATGA